ncbi:MAG TPA: hypothetical protein VEH51_08780 [Burkholderiales bacterium]|nr:hypothetical protein [Burkholderiales bacterium]
MRYLLVLLVTLLGAVRAADAQVSIGIGLPNVSIGINVPVYPQFVPVPGYPVYYAPHLHANYFFYDGAYWVYRGDRWYASTWYNGPWTYVDPYHVPLFVLRVPVRYYRDPPPYFHGWRGGEPPRWGEHWGHEWSDRNHGWEHWDRHDAPRAAPLPRYQRNYSGDRYPHAEDRRREIETRNYQYQPHDPRVREHYEERGRGHGSADYGRGPGGDRGRGPGGGDHGRGPGGGDDQGQGHGR